MSGIRVEFGKTNPQTEKEQEIRYAEERQNKADLAYLSMMTGVDLDDEEEDE